MLYGYLIENFKPYEPIFTADIDTYIGLYPTKVYKNLYETGVVYAIASNNI